jgi:LCP family protein required for cell wall assembly
MILLSMDPLNNAAAVIAIPRDMWVAVPGFGYYKINTAFRLGELYNLPGGGPGLAARTVEEFLGVPVHFYAQVDFQAFVDFIDHINGIKITVDEPFTVDRRGKWNTVVLEPGTYVLDGEYALAYARNRSTEQDDFDRSQRQLEVILAIRQRVLEFDQLPHLVLNAPNIYEDLSAGIRTNMSLEQVIQLAWKAREIPRENIHMAVIGPEYVTIGASPEGLSILKPIPDKIRLLRDEVLGAGGVVSPMAEGDLLDLVAEENAQIHVLNGSGVAGLATRTTAWLEEQGFNALESGNAAAETTVSKITIQGSCPYALRWLVETFGMTAGAIQHDFVPDAEPDLILILGSDWATNNPIP